MELSPPRGVICGYDVGLDKTIVTPSLVLLSAAQPSTSVERGYRPTLILFLSSASTVWKAVDFSALRVLTYFGFDMGLFLEETRHTRR